MAEGNLPLISVQVNFSGTVEPLMVDHALSEFRSPIRSGPRSLVPNFKLRMILATFS